MQRIMEAWRKHVQEDDTTAPKQKLSGTIAAKGKKNVIAASPRMDMLAMNNILVNHQDALEEWGKLQGDGKFLGRGTMGVTYLYGDKVLKITFDDREANAAALIVGLAHPNLYNVHKVGKLSDDRLQSGDYDYEYKPHALVYDYLDPPSDEQKAISDAFGWVLRQGLKLQNQNTSLYHWKAEDLVSAARTAKENISVTGSFKNIANESIEAALIDHPEAIGLSRREGFLLYTALVVNSLEANSLSDSKVANLPSLIDNLKDNRLAAMDDLASAITTLLQKGIIFQDVHYGNVMAKGSELVIIDIGLSLTNRRGAIDLVEHISSRIEQL